MSRIVWLLVFVLGSTMSRPSAATEDSAAGGEGEKAMRMELQSRDPETGEPTRRVEDIVPSRTAIVVVDVWDYHWCSTWVGRAGTMIPRMNKACEAARKLGFTIVFSPTDCSGGHAGEPAREAMAALPPHALPEPIDFDPPAPWSFGLGSGCMCGGPYPCVVNYDNSRQDPRLIVKDGDFMSSGHQELYNLCQEKGLTHLIYMGGATNMCLVHKPEGMIGMRRLGLDCILARDITQAHGPNTGSENADEHTAFSVAHIEKHIGPSVNFVEELCKAGVWDDAWIVDSVMIAPWGFPGRPKFFDDTLTVSLSNPRVAGAEIRYTLDGSEPGADSALYEGPFSLDRTATVRAAAFRDGRCASRESKAFFVHMPPAPPKPDVFVSDLQPIKMNMALWSEWYEEGSRTPPLMDRSYRDGPLRLRGVEYAKGIGLRAPSQLLYELKPDYGAFVARAGVDEWMLAMDSGRGRAMYPAVVFRIFIDGRQVAESPVMRISQEPWRFHVEIPEGSRLISLTANRDPEDRVGDLVEWVDAGFVLRKP